MGGRVCRRGGDEVWGVWVGGVVGVCVNVRGRAGSRGKASAGACDVYRGQV